MGEHHPICWGPEWDKKVQKELFCPSLGLRHQSSLGRQYSWFSGLWSRLNYTLGFPGSQLKTADHGPFQPPWSPAPNPIGIHLCFPWVLFPWWMRIYTDGEEKYMKRERLSLVHPEVTMMPKRQRYDISSYKIYGSLWFSHCSLWFLDSYLHTLEV